MIQRIVISFIILCLTLNNFATEPDDIPVKNIILLIGDGMGTAQIFAGYTANKGYLELERSEFIGFSKVSSANSYITDSGAGGTAMSTGKKTSNGAIGVDTNGVPHKTILEAAEENQLSTGLISTSSITHATPASFVAHNSSRENYEAIALDFLDSGIDLFIGGGKDNFENRSDSINLSDKLRERGYSVVYDLSSIQKEDRNSIACFAAALDMPKVSDGRGDFLPDATRLALDRLSTNHKGFFIMIEGSQIDWGGHDNDINYVVSEMIDFDKAAGVAFDFADKNPGTLVIITADHETGGLALTGGDLKSGTIEAVFASRDHTAVMVPVFAYGTGSYLFAGIYENTELYYKMMQLLKLK
jgi:alkaline phosphatase